MNNKYEFFIAGRTRNKENILKICNLFDKYKISYYCFLKNEDDWGYGNKNQTVIDICQSKGLSLILWNVDTEDWKSRNTDTIVNKFLNDTDDGDIVLMHDIYGTTIDAVEILLERLTKKGYHFVTVSELYKYKKGISLEPGKAYYGM